MSKNKKPLRERLLPDDDSPDLGSNMHDNEADNILNQRFAINDESFHDGQSSGGVQRKGSQSHP